MNDPISYRTISSQSEAYLKELGSKFHAVAYQVNQENDVNECLIQCKEAFPGATHYCYAWRIGTSGDFFRANDDGEPGNSAGQPILRAILSHDLTNVLIIVVRFYGGKKLGIPGLIASYGNVANEALMAAEVIEVEPTIIVAIKDITKKDYRVYEFASRHDLKILDAPNQIGGEFKLSVKQQSWLNLQEILKELPNFDWQLVQSDI